jgi:lipopolysaccharide transport system permease protein
VLASRAQRLEWGRFWQLVWMKVGLNLRTEISVYYLSYAWWVLEPILYMAVFYVVFGIFRNRGGSDFVAFLLTGLVPWLWFSKSVGNSMLSMISGRSLIGQRRITKAFFPLVIVCQDLVKQVVIFLLLLAFLLIYGIEPTRYWLWIIPLALVQFILIVAFALLSSLLVAFVRDFQFMIRTGLILGMFSSGIFYHYKELLIGRHHNLFLSNPMASLLESYRNVLLRGEEPLTNFLLYTLAGSIVALIVLLALIERYDNRLTRMLIE